MESITRKRDVLELKKKKKSSGLEVKILATLHVVGPHVVQ